MKSEAVPAADTEIKKDEILSEELKVETPKESTTPVEPEPVATVPPAAASVPTEDEKMDIDEPIKVEKEPLVAAKDSEETPVVALAPSVPTEEEKSPVKRTDISSAAGNGCRSYGGNFRIIRLQTT